MSLGDGQKYTQEGLRDETYISKNDKSIPLLVLGRICYPF